MPAALPSPAIHHSSLPDALLLQGWAQRRDEASFRALADRYGALVLAAARRCAGHADLAEEAAQLVFTILARKAGALGSVPLVAWLHRTTVLECRSLLRRESRHRRRARALAEESGARDAAASGSDDSAWQDVLDEAINRLGDDDRRILLMRFFEDLSFREIAERAGRSEAAVQRQGHRAMQRLGGLLRRRGVVLPGTVLTAGLGASAVNGSAAGFIGVILSGTVPPPGAVTLLLNTLYNMTRTKLTVTTAVAVALLAAVPIGWQWRENGRLARDLERSKSHAAELERRLAALESRVRSAGSEMASSNRSATDSPVTGSGTVTPDAAAGAPDILMGAGEQEVATRIAARLTQIRTAVAIRPVQEKALQQAAAARSAAVLAAFGRIRQNQAIPPDMGILTEWGTGALRIRLDAVLDAEQAAAWREVEARERTGRIENLASMELVEMQSQGALHLTPEQKDAAFAAVAGILTDEDAAGDALYADDGRFTERMKDSIERRREAMKSVLDAGQQVEYSRMLDEDFSQVMKLFPAGR